MKKWIAAVYRYTRAIVVVLAITLAVVLVSVVSIDLGPSLKAQAERGGKAWLDRGMHIGRLGVLIGRGRFVLDDVVIDGASLVTTYRGSFNDQVQRGGIDGLLKTLADRNAGPAAAAPKK